MGPTVHKTDWMRWSDLQQLAGNEAMTSTVHLCERILRQGAIADSLETFLQESLTDLASELSAQRAAIVRKSPPWNIVHAVGREFGRELPAALLDECLDREAAGVVMLHEPAGWSAAATPLQVSDTPGADSSDTLLIFGRKLADDVLPIIMAAGRALSLARNVAATSGRNRRRIEQLKATLRLASQWSSTRETEPLLHRIAEEATRVLEADRASIFIWDRERGEVVACPALGVDSGSLRLPDTAGIVGEVLRTGESLNVQDAYTDPRFERSVDRASGYTTRNLLCSPLRNESGKLIGAFEVINKQQGAFDPDDTEILTELGIQAASALANARAIEQLARSNRQLAERVTRGVKIIGESAAIVALRTTIERLGATDLPVLILGESGTGKEVVSQALHFHGPRAERPFVAVNCAAIAESLLESELFGHEKGAFTDARDMRQGKFELADGGTLFLDEIGDMSPGGQAKLLRVLEQKVITRVGGSQPIPINVRVIAATNAKLAELVRERKFREDLYYRLSVVTLDLPPLRDRPDDIIPLAEYFLGQFSTQANRRTLSLSADARKRLQAHSWPGNVRELRNLMERLAFLAPNDRIEAGDLAFILSPLRDDALELGGDLGLTEATRQFQQDHIRRCIDRVRGNMSEAARLLGLHRSNLYRKMRQLDMNAPDEAE